MGRLDDQFFELLAFANRLEDPAKTTCLAFVLGISRTIRTIFDDVLGTAFVTAFMFCYHDKNTERPLMEALTCSTVVYGRCVCDLTTGLKRPKLSVLTVGNQGGLKKLRAAAVQPRPTPLRLFAETPQNLLPTEAERYLPLSKGQRNLGRNWQGRGCRGVYRRPE